jgi:hypothetical protein
MTLGYRYHMGVGGVDHQCRASFLYYEPAAYLTTQYVLKTNGLDTVEKKKLKLGPYVLDSKLQIDEKTHIEARDKASHSDIEELMEFRGEYGNSDSLTLKGSQFMHASEKSEYTYKKAYEYFERALEIDSTDP